jgi:predicted phage terminase large subunit-like protein
MDVARSWLAGTAARWSELEKTWAFPSGATLTFGYLDGPQDHFRYQSSQFQACFYDELTQFDEADYRYLFSRLRRLEGSTIPVRMRAASNPGGRGHQWVRQRFLDEPGPERIFLPASLDDNPFLDRGLYTESLMQLDPITRQQLLNGDWSARQSGNKFRREWFEIVEAAPEGCQMVRFWDLAATEPKPGRDPDWTAGCLMGKSQDNTLYLIHMAHMRGTPGAVEALVRQTAETDGRSVAIRMEQEPGASGVKVVDDYSRRVLMGYDFRGVPSTGSKEVRANPLASQAERGNVKLVKGPWIGAFLDEAELFPQGAHDDMVDAAASALAELSGGAEVRISWIGGSDDDY